MECFCLFYLILSHCLLVLAIEKCKENKKEIAKIARSQRKPMALYHRYLTLMLNARNHTNVQWQGFLVLLKNVGCLLITLDVSDTTSCFTTKTYNLLHSKTNHTDYNLHLIGSNQKQLELCIEKCLSSP